MSLRHTTITVDGRCIDLLLTEEEVAEAFERSLRDENRVYLDASLSCASWPVNPPPECPLWRRILGICRECDK